MVRKPELWLKCIKLHVNDVELEGFAFAFTASSGSYVFKDAVIAQTRFS